MKINKRKIYSINEDCSLAELHSMAYINNSRVSSGEESVVTIGHSHPDADVLTVAVGTADNFVVEGDGLYADLDIDDTFEDILKKFKYNKVSVERWPDGVITPIALLAKNRPKLDLGVCRYEMPKRGEMGSKPYIMEDEEVECNQIDEEPKNIEVENMTSAEVEQLFVETLNHSEFFGKFADLMENVIPKLQNSMKVLEDTLAPLMAEEAEEAEHNDIAPELKEEAEVLEGEPSEPEVSPKEESVEGDGEKDKEMKEEVEKNDMAPAASSANNTYIPEFVSKDKSDKVDKKKKDEEDMVKHYQMKLLEASTEAAEMRNRYQVEARKNELLDLSRTYMFEPDDEIGIVSNMNAEQWDMHKKIIVTRYQRSPVGRSVNVVTDSNIMDPQVVKQDKVNRAIKYSVENKVSFKEALDRV